jgi:cytochrome c biogenesis protein CcmG/thiol:disulfide interchange protein DsbE
VTRVSLLRPGIGENESVNRLYTISTAILLAFALAIPAVPAVPRKNTLLNKPAPALARASVDDQRVDLSALRGRVVLLNFWATWCAPCQVEMPRFIEWQSKYQSDGLSIIGVSMDDDSAPVKSFVHKRGLNYPVVLGDEKLGLAYGGILGLPVTYLIDRNGIVRARYEGETHLAAMETAIRRLLRKR